MAKKLICNRLGKRLGHGGANAAAARRNANFRNAAKRKFSPYEHLRCQHQTNGKPDPKIEIVKKWIIFPRKNLCASTANNKGLNKTSSMCSTLCVASAVSRLWSLAVTDARSILSRRRKSKPGSHADGYAVDIGVRGEQALQVIRSAMEHGIKRIGVNQKGDGRFIHLDVDPNGSALRSGAIKWRLFHSQSHLQHR